jgi:hypothetical protein
MIKVVAPGLIILFTSAYASAQYYTPTIDGTISSAEYGTHTNGQNQQTNGSSVWYCTWDTAYVYFAVSGGFDAANYDAMNVYVDVNPSIPVNGGTGRDTGASYDSITPQLPFSSDAFLFVKLGYRDRNTISSNAWSSDSGASSNISEWVNTSANVIESRVAWTDLGVSSMPSSFNWLGYMSNDNVNANIFSQIPTANPGGVNPAMVRYYTVSTTDSIGATKPFAQESYTHVGSSDGSFGAISVFDFTMNSSGDSIIRSTGDWTITGDLAVYNGTLGFGSTASATTLAGIDVGASGVLKLSTGANNVDINGSFNNSGTFYPGTSTTIFKQNGASITGNFNDSSGVSNNFGSLVIDVDSIITVSADLFLKKPTSSAVSLTVTSGELKLTTQTLSLDRKVTVSGSYIDTARISLTTGKVRWYIDSISTYMLPIGGLTKISPFTVVLNSGTFAADAHLDFTVTEAKHPQNASPADYLNRYWGVANTGISAFDADVQMNYPTSDVTGDETNLYSGKYSSSAWTLGNPYSTSGVLQMASISSFSDFSGGTPAYLPVVLQNFKAEEVKGVISINWETTSELNCSHFNLIKVVENRQVTIATLDGAGNSSSLQSYSAIDYSPNELNVYTLEQSDYDGGVIAYGPIVISMESQQKLGYYHDNSIYIRAKGIESVKVMDLMGNILLSETDAAPNTRIDITKLARKQLVLIDIHTNMKRELLKAYLN